jgi:hypothetical protein
VVAVAGLDLDVQRGECFGIKVREILRLLRDDG